MDEALPIGTPAITMPPGKAVRFAIFGDDGRRSSTWAAWTSKHRLDAYIQALPMRQSWKVSLHESGSWQHGLLKESTAAESLPPGQSRHWDIWASPDEMAPGIRRGFCVVIPDSELRAIPTGADDRDTIRVPAPGLGYAAFIEFIFMGAESPQMDLVDPVFDIAVVQRVDGSALRIVARQVKLSEEQRDFMNGSRRRIKTQFSLPQVAGRFRLVFMGEIGQDGTRAAWELAYDQ